MRSPILQPARSAALYFSLPRNREKDRTAIEETFRRLVELVNSLDEEQKRAAEEGLSEDELALFDLLQKENLGKSERERVKQASQDLLALLQDRLRGLDRFWEKEQTKADVEVFNCRVEVMPKVAFWHIADVRRLRVAGPLTGALPTFGAECRVIGAFQTLRWHAAKVGS